MRFYLINRLLFFLMLFSPLVGETHPVYFESFIPGSNGRSLPIIHCVTQSSQGFIWITSPYGLARYDGRDFLIFQHEKNDPASLIDNYLFSVFEDSKGNLWITTEKGLELFDKKTGRFIHFQHDPQDSNSLPSNKLRTIGEDKDGYLWIGTFDAGVCRFDSETQNFTQYPHDPNNINSLSSNSVWAICCDAEGKIWIGTHEGLLDCYDKKQDRWTHYNLLPLNLQYSGNSNIWDLLLGKNGKIWIGTSNIGLIGLNPDTGVLDRIALREDKKNWVIDYKILSLLQDRDGMIWMGTDRAGIFCYDPVKKNVEHFTVDTTKAGSLSDNTVPTVFEDREGLLWFGTAKGISRLNKNKFRFPLVQYNAQSLQGLSDNNILALYEDREELVWISTARGGLNVWDRKKNVWNQSIIPENVFEPFRNYPVQGFYEDDQGDLWMGNSLGLYVYERRNNKISHIQNTESRDLPSSFSITFMAPGKNDSLWLGTRTGELFEWAIKTRRLHYHPNSQQNIFKSWYEINTISVDNQGGIWVGTQWHGIDCLDPESGNWAYYRPKTDDPHSIPSSTVYSFTKDKTGKIWIGTEEGPCYLDREKQEWHKLSDEIHLPDNTAYGLLADESDRIWMSTNSGLIQIDQQSLTWRMYGPEDGLQDRVFNPGVCFKNQKGEMYFGGISGFNHFHPDDIHLNPYPPPVAVTAFQTSTSKTRTDILDGDNMFKISKKDLPVVFHMAALSFSFPQKNHYRVTALDNGQEEIFSGTRNSFALGNLKRGKNRFLIQASNHDLIWNENGIELTIIVTSSVFSSRMVYVLLVLTAGAAFWFFARRNCGMKRNKKSEESYANMPALRDRFKLTKREMEIVALVLEGKTNKEIEGELYISLKTVKTHLYNIYRKFNVQSRLRLMNTVKDYLNKKLF